MFKKQKGKKQGITYGLGNSGEQNVNQRHIFSEK